MDDSTLRSSADTLVAVRCSGQVVKAGPKDRVSLLLPHFEPLLEADGHASSKECGQSSMDNLVLFLLCNPVCTMRHARGPALSSGPCPHRLPACMQAEPHIAAARIIRSASRVSLTLPESMGLRMALLLTWRTLHRLGQRHSQVCTIRCCSLVQSNSSLLSGCETRDHCSLAVACFRRESLHLSDWRFI